MTVARSRTPPPANTSSILSRTRSQPLSLLSIARLNIARSRRRPSICSRTRIVQTSFGFSGRFWPIRRPLFQGARWRVGIEFSVVIVVSDADPFHLSARSTTTGCGSLPRKGARPRSQTFPTPSGNGEVGLGGLAERFYQEQGVGAGRTVLYRPQDSGGLTKQRTIGCPLKWRKQATARPVGLSVWCRILSGGTWMRSPSALIQ